jgi:hypothetical protein
VFINSSVPGNNVIDATTTFSVLGVSLTRSTAAGQDAGPDGSDSAEKEYIGGEACSPGFWKQPHHFGHYPLSIVHPLTTTYGSIFNQAPAPWAGMTFPQAISANGGGGNVLARHSGAAYLNSQTIAYLLTPGEVVILTNNAWADFKDGSVNDNDDLDGNGVGDYHQALSAFSGLLEDENCTLSGRLPLPGAPLRPNR